MEKKNFIIEAVLLAAGLFALGSRIKAGIDQFADKDRRVVVKGLSTQEVPANKVTWPIVTAEIGNDVQELYTRISEKNAAIVQFLKENGLADGEISVNPPVINDRNAQNYSESAAVRYNVTCVITVTSTQVDKVRAIMAKQGELLRQGIAVVRNYENPVRYEYTDFQSIKSKMLDESIENARTTAEQIASRCGSRLRRLETASQGVFSIEDRDADTPYIKQLRVVSTVTYSLKD